MKRALLAVALGFLALFARAPDAAAGTVGVVVTGAPTLQPPLVAQLESWLRGHGHEVMAKSLDLPAINRLIDCFTVDDSSCARKVVEKSARSESVVFARASREGPTVSLTVYWVLKGKPAVGARRGCDECSESALRGAADEIMAGLAPAAAVATGRLKLTSKPDGLIVMLDSVKVGVTPLERDLAAGSHSIVLIDGGTRVGERTVQIPTGATVDVAMAAEYPSDDPRRPLPPPSRTVPVVLFAGGAAAIAGSTIAFYLGQKDGPDEKYIYRGATAAGIAIAATGVVSIGAGIWLWRRGTRESMPIAAISSRGGYFGWQGSF
ncbi:MAG TPA: PEGA domain-containing protein [Kofleriaceae bacterium]|nr:PEGA domain-containing protein [Kofleriaceae bacterium]